MIVNALFDYMAGGHPGAFVVIFCALTSTRGNTSFQYFRLSYSTRKNEIVFMLVFFKEHI